MIHFYLFLLKFIVIQNKLILPLPFKNDDQIKNIKNINRYYPAFNYSTMLLLHKFLLQLLNLCSYFLLLHFHPLLFLLRNHALILLYANVVDNAHHTYAISTVAASYVILHTTIINNAIYLIWYFLNLVDDSLLI